MFIEPAMSVKLRRSGMNDERNDREHIGIDMPPRWG